MALKIFIGDEIQDFLKEGSAETLFGLQLAPKNKMLLIYGAVWGSSDSITSVEAVKIGANKREISRTTLANTLIIFNTDKYIVDVAESYASDLDLCIYYIEFANASETFKTENNEEQSFLWDISGDTLFGLQLATNNKLLKIYNAEWASDDAITSIKAIKINTLGEIISETDLATDLIIYENGQYQAVDDKLLVTNLDACIYYIEFNNGTVFKTEPFLVVDSEIEVNNFIFEDNDNFIFEDGENFIFEK
jgi:hypothetical protein